MKLIPRNYKINHNPYIGEKSGPDELRIVWGRDGLRTLLGSGMVAVLQEAGTCATALHYSRKQPAIPKGTKVEIESVWFNLYGTYARVLYKGLDYDIDVRSLGEGSFKED